MTASSTARDASASGRRVRAGDGPAIRQVWRSGLQKREQPGDAVVPVAGIRLQRGLGLVDIPVWLQVSWGEDFRGSGDSDRLPELGQARGLGLLRY
ncbi:MAG: hypothetical protein R3C45_01905 [Phycisphaerales bacterium]